MEEALNLSSDRLLDDDDDDDGVLLIYVCVFIDMFNIHRSTLM